MRPQVAVTAYPDFYSVNVAGTFGGGYTARSTRERIAQDAVRGMRYNLCDRRAVDLVVMGEQWVIDELRGLGFSPNEKFAPNAA